MNYIQLTDEQFAACRQSAEPVEVRGPGGEPVGTLFVRLPWETPEFIADAVRRAKGPGPWYPAEQVIDRYRELLAEKDRGRTFDDKFVRWFVKQPDGSALREAGRRESA